MSHGCQAGRQPDACFEVYRDRISRGTEGYVVHKLGAFGADLEAVACFFEALWNRVSPSFGEWAQSWLLNLAALRLRALGRLVEAVTPTRMAMVRDIDNEDWKGAAVNASNLSELELTMGDIEGAVRDAEQSVDFADRTSDPFERKTDLTTLADALHQAGRSGDALARFREAVAIDPFLYSLSGFRYCDLLLADAERAAWQAEGIGATHRNNPLPQGERGPELCREVERMAGLTLVWAKQETALLDIALDHLTLGRAALYRSILERLGVTGAPAASTTLDSASEIEQAVDGLRRAGTAEFLVRGLLTRAWLRCRSGDAADARADLDEAREIAERGPMPLFQADVQLYRARLFSDRQALVEARRLIEKHGYCRRLGELADAEAAAEAGSRATD